MKDRTSAITGRFNSDGQVTGVVKMDNYHVMQEACGDGDAHLLALIHGLDLAIKKQEGNQIVPLTGEKGECREG